VLEVDENGLVANLAEVRFFACAWWVICVLFRAAVVLVLAITSYDDELETLRGNDMLMRLTELTFDAASTRMTANRQQPKQKYASIRADEYIMLKFRYLPVCSCANGAACLFLMIFVSH
jgi:hypothetical protein